MHTASIILVLSALSSALALPVGDTAPCAINRVACNNPPPGSTNVLAIGKMSRCGDSDTSEDDATAIGQAEAAAFAKRKNNGDVSDADAEAIGEAEWAAFAKRKNDGKVSDGDAEAIGEAEAAAFA
jgi:hypothetical protein